MRQMHHVMCAALLVAGCGGKGAAFTNLFPDNKPEQIDLVLSTVGDPSAIADPVNGTGSPVAAVVLDEGKAIALVDLEKGKTIWKQAMAVDSIPAIGPGKVVVRSGDEIVALDVSSGEKSWSRGLDEQYYYGAAFDSGLVIVTQGNTDGGLAATGRRGVVVALDAGSGGKKWSVEVEKMLGAPAARGGLAFIPWDRQSISILDARSGDEVCRILRQDGTVDFVVAAPEGVFYGSKKDLMRLTPGAAGGTKEGAAHLDFDPEKMPGQPPLYADTYESSKAVLGARARIRLLWSPAVESAEDSLALADGSVGFLYYSYVLSLDAASGGARWVYKSEKPLAWASAANGGVFAIEETGRIVFLAGGSGLPAEIGSIEGKAESASFDTGAWSPEISGEGKSLLWGLRDLVFDVDTQVLPLRKYALELMAKLPQDEITMDLLEIMRSAYVPKAMRDQAALMLREREGGVDFLKDALKYHADFLQDQGAPPVGAIASALANANEKSALPLLLDHLRDHETPASDLVELTAAVLVIGDVSAVPDLEKFLTLYHADSSLSTQIDVLVNVAKGIVKFGGDDGKAFVQSIVDDPFTGDVLASKLKETLK